MPKLILFDIDGTLVLIRGAGREAKARAMEEIFGMDAGVRSHPFGGKTDRRILNELMLDKGYTEAQLIAQMDIYQERMAYHLERIIGKYNTEACPGVHDLLGELNQQNDILLGLVTGNVQSTAPIKLQSCGIDPTWFSVGAYGSESADRNDLSRLAHDRAQQHHGQPIAPQDVIVIGDTAADIECARAIGAVAVGVFTGFEYAADLRQAKPDYLLKDLTEFRTVVPL